VKDFSHASFPPDTIGIMTMAMESILRSSKEGERDHRVLARMALLELMISPRN
jgi:hypothetical protein